MAKKSKTPRSPKADLPGKLKPFSFPLIPEDDPIYTGVRVALPNPKSDTPPAPFQMRSVEERMREKYLANQWVRDRNKNK